MSTKRMTDEDIDRLVELEAAQTLAEEARRARTSEAKLAEALEALRDPEGHVVGCHARNASSPGPCVGECKAARAALAKVSR
jgi:hypothetical protein